MDDEAEKDRGKRKKLHDTRQRLTPSMQKKANNLWRYMELLKLNKQYDKTTFIEHTEKVIDLGGLFEKCSTLHKKFLDVDVDIEMVHNMSIAMKDEVKKCKQSGNAAAIEVAEQDYQENEDLLQRHNKTKKGVIRSFIEILDEWEYVKMH